MLNIHENIKSKLNNFIEYKKIPNIIFHGVSGSGKKTILFDFLNQIYSGNKQYLQNYVMTVNCAHGKGIKFIREELKFFARTNIDLKEGNIFKSIILLNADKLTIDAQSALRRCIELFSHSTRFFIVIDDKYKLLRPILSRFCEIFIPQPCINNKIINLHTHILDICFNIYKSNKLKKQKFRTDFDKLKNNINNTKITIFTMSERLYEKGYSCLDIINYIENMEIDAEKKYEYLVFAQKIKGEIRDEKLLMTIVLYFILIRSDYKLENISFM